MYSIKDVENVLEKVIKETYHDKVGSITLNIQHAEIVDIESTITGSIVMSEEYDQLVNGTKNELLENTPT